MKYIKVHSSDPFVIVCDGHYEENLAYCRLDRGPFVCTRTTEHWDNSGLLEITLPKFMRLHDGEFD